MPQLSLTDFVDVVSKSGTPKATKVSEVKHRPPYDPAFDFYKALRELIIGTHKSGHPKATLNSAITSISDPKKITAYPAIVAGYSKWWGRKALTWFDPQTSIFSLHGVDIIVNPELGLEINGQKHLIKLYFKSDALAKNRVDIITHMMSVALGSLNPGATMSVLDIRKSKLHSPTVPIPHLNAIVDAELAYIEALWKQV